MIATASFYRVRGACPTSWRRTTHAEDFCWLSGKPPLLGPITRAIYRYGFETVGNSLNPSHGQNSLCRFAAEAKIQDRSRDKDRTKYRPGLFTRLLVIPAKAGTQRKQSTPSTPFAKRRGRGSPNDRKQTAGDAPRTRPRHSRGALSRHSRYGGGNPEKNKARRLTSPLPRWVLCTTNVIPA